MLSVIALPIYSGSNSVDYFAKVEVDRVSRVANQVDPFLTTVWQGRGTLGASASTGGAERDVQDSLTKQVQQLVNDILAARSAKE